MEGEFCVNHTFEMAEDMCRECGHLYCSECLVYSFGPKKPPFCVRCAVSAAGIRSNSARGRSVSKRELKKRQRMRKKESKKGGREETLPVSSSFDWTAIEGGGNGGLVARPVDEGAAEPAEVEYDDVELRPSFDQKLSRSQH